MVKEKENKFKISVKGNIRDLLAFKNLVSDRKKNIEKASNKPIRFDPIYQLVQNLHPKKQYLIISDIKDETKSTKTYRLVPDPDSETKKLAFFRAGQYLSLRVQVNGISITRPYSLSSSPSDAIKGFYEITIRKEENGFLTNFIWENWDIGTKIQSSGPEGNLYYEPLRDSEHIVGLAGGSGISPFRSIAREILQENLQVKLTLIYGSSDEEDIIFYNEFKRMEEEFPDKIKAIFVLSCDEVHLEGCEKGFISTQIIKKYVDITQCSFFICGPHEMYSFVEQEIEKLKIPPKRVRREVFGEIKTIVDFPGFPQEFVEKTFKLNVQIGNLIKELPGLATESILVALERANLAPPSRCRSGECGYCRSVLLSGNIYVNPITDQRRSADKQLNYFHACSSYPLSDLKIEIPRKK